MFDIGASELLVVGVVALVVIGPKELPGVLRTVGKTVGNIRKMAGEFQAQFSEAMREAEMEEARKKVSEIGESVTSALDADKAAAATPAPPPADAEIHAAATAEINPPLPEPAQIAPESLPSELQPPASVAANESVPPKAAGHAGS